MTYLVLSGERRTSSVWHDRIVALQLFIAGAVSITPHQFWNFPGFAMANEINPVNWFEIPVNDLERAKSFYESVFNIEMPIRDMGPLRMAWFPMVERGPGSTGSLVQAESYVPSHSGSMVYLSVDDIEATLEKVNAHGGKTLNSKTGIGEYGFVAHFEDCEGNRVALHATS